MDAKKMFKVKNRSTSMVVYNLPEKNLRREFAPGETRTVPFEELEALSFQPGGRELMASFLQIEAVEATRELGIKREPEYDLSEEQIRQLLLTGSLDEFLDCLDFAPVGVIDLIKQMAVALPLTDMNKAAAIKKKTGFDVMQALVHMREEQESDEGTEAAAEAKPERRVKKEEKSTVRRTTPKYTVVSTTGNK